MRAPRFGLVLLLGAAASLADGPRELTYRAPYVVDFDELENRRYLNGAVGDLNGDGRADVLLVGQGEEIRYMPGTPDGGLTGVTTEIDEHYRGGTGLGLFEAIDVDGDGDDDVVANSRDVSVLVFRNDGGGVFTKLPAEPGDDIRPGSPVLFDLGGDGDLDTISSVYRLPYRTDDGYRVFENLGTSFVPGQRFLFPTGGFPPHVADMNGDGLDDLVLVRPTQTVVMLQTPAGDLVAKPAVAYATGAQAAVAIDIDGDGDVDVLAYGHILRNDGTGDLVAEPLSFARQFLLPVVVDFDNDGLDDVVDFGTGITIELLRNSGGAFAAPEVIGTGLVGNGVRFAVEDLDEDGLPDLVAVNYSSTTVSVVRQTGSRAPQDLAVTPAVIRETGAVPLDLVGSGFADGATVDVGAGIVANSVVVSSPNAARANLTVDPAIGGGARNVRFANPDGQVALAPVEVHSLDAQTNGGKLFATPAPARDTLRVKGRMPRNPLSSNDAFAGRADGLRLEIGSGPSRLSVVVPAGDPRWKARGKRLVFQTLPDEYPRIRVSVDTKKETFQLDVSYFDYPQAPADASLHILSGDDLGRDAGTWTPKRDGRHFTIR